MEDPKPKLYIVLYSLYHHVYKLALKVAEGARAEGCEVTIFQVQETLSQEVLEKMHAPPRPNLPIITAPQLIEADGFLFGFPTRFGFFPTQMKALLDATGSLWTKRSLAQKFGGFFFSTASQNGGQETTAFTAVTYLADHGINYVPFGYADPTAFDNSKVMGGSPYGAGTISNGDSTRQPIEEELGRATKQGANFAKLLVTYHRGLKKRELEEPKVKQPTSTSPTTSVSPTSKIGKMAGATVAAGLGSGAVATGIKAAQRNNNGNPVSPTKTSEPASLPSPTTAVAPAMSSEPNQLQPVEKEKPSESNQPQPVEKEKPSESDKPVVAQIQAQPPERQQPDEITPQDRPIQAPEVVNQEKETPRTPQRVSKLKKFWIFCCGGGDSLE